MYTIHVYTYTYIYIHTYEFDKHNVYKMYTDYDTCMYIYIYLHGYCLDGSLIQCDTSIRTHANPPIIKNA